MELATKTFGAFEIKSVDRGEVEAVVATLNVVDRDREVILPGAIPDGAQVKMSAYGHDTVYGAPPVGKGVLRVTGNQAVFQGRLFLSIDRGRETLAILKEMGPTQDWSFGFSVLDSEGPSADWRAKGARRMLTRLDPFEVSPVMRGAGVGTGTLSAKAARARNEIETLAVQHQVRELKALGLGPGLSHPPVPLLTFIAFAQHHLEIPEGQRPQIRMVKAFADPHQIGSYSPVTHAIRLREDLDGLAMRRTVAHELAHAKEALTGRAHSEAFAQAAAEGVLAAWNLHRWRDVA